MEKRMLVAIAASVGILLIWNFLFPTQTPINKNTKIEQSKLINNKTITNANANANENFALGEESNSIDPASIKDINLENSLVKLVFTNQGGVLKQAILKNYKDQNNNQIQILNFDKNEYFPLGIIFNKSPLNKELNTKIWEADLTDKKITFSYKSSNNVAYQKEFTLNENNYSIITKVKIVNLDASPITIPAHTLIWEPILKDTETTKKEENLIVNLDDKVKHKALTKIDDEYISTIIKTKNIAPDKNNWISFSNKYFVVSMIPNSGIKKLWINKKIDGENSLHTMGLTAEEKTLRPEETSEEVSEIYIGPKEYGRLQNFGKRFEENIDFGFFGILSKGLLVILRFLNNYLHNYGLTIIIITIVTKILFMPLTEKSFISMKNTQKVQPEIDALKQKYKNDPQRLNAEVLKIYKEKKVNPFGGCLPMLAQVPIFIALFNALNNAIELRQAPFIWWIKDLSRPDTVTHIGSFGINILPVFMIISMVIQQKMTTPKGTKISQEQEMQQKMLLYIMPLAMGVMFYTMPSGLVLYWFLSNTLGIIHQYFINKKLSLQN